MKLVVVYRPNSEHGRLVEEFVHSFSAQYPESRFELLNIDGRDGAAMASLYDITNYPALLALRDDGLALQIWQGEQLPLMSDVASYTLG